MSIVSIATDIVGATNKTILTAASGRSIVASFTTVGITNVSIRGAFTSFDILVIGGGGGGGSANGDSRDAGGGGGGGGAVYRTGVTLPNGTFSVTVGAGGNFANGGNSTFSGFTGLGGGAGGGWFSGPGSSGGCGGGGAGEFGAAGVGLQGFNGAAGRQQNTAGGGGGGMGAIGTQPNGGNGLQYPITGTSIFYAGGGAGGFGGSIGGLGGGGNRSQPGTDGLGGGGGNAARGGSGIVIIRGYVSNPSPIMRLSNQTVIQQTATFLATGATQTWSVPAGVFNVKFFLWGAGGTGQNGGNFSFAGSAAYVEGNLVTTPGTNYSIVAGRRGAVNTSPAIGNGGAAAGGTGAGGGGFSGIFLGTPGVNTVIAIAGGGGGGGANGSGVGGGGGFPSGLAATGTNPGGGGTQLAGGTGGFPGSQFLGGVAGFGGDCCGGAGGGGFFGGGGSSGGAGGGGSSTVSSVVINPVTANGRNGRTSGDTPPLPGGSSSPYWISPLGSSGQTGLVVIGFSIAYSSQNIYSYKYVRFTILLARGGSTTEYQLSEFQLKLQGVFVNYTGVTITPNTTGAEGSIRVFDGNVGTKYFAVGQGNNFVLTSPTTFTFDSYTWATASDVPDRDPVRWRVEGSTDNTNWIILDDKSNTTQSVTTSRQTYLPDISLPSREPVAYTMGFQAYTPSFRTAVTFLGTGSVQTFTVPTDVRVVRIFCWGSGGGTSGGSGGGGGFSAGSLMVSAGQVLHIVVGRLGQAGIANGGGSAGNGGAGGGGFSGVFSQSSPGITNLLLVAGGGGGAGVVVGATGGGGGFPNGGNGGGQGGAQGGTQTAGGLGGEWPGYYRGGFDGTQLAGGPAGTLQVGGGGGGGGFWGGGGGFGPSVVGIGNGGGGGSSFIMPSFRALQYANGTSAGAAGNEASPYWQSPLGRAGQNGLVVIAY